MKRRSVVHIVVIVAVGLLGLAPAVVCAMPADCPMTQTPAAAHDCCLPTTPGPVSDGMAAAPCHAIQIAGAPAIASAVSPSSLVASSHALVPPSPLSLSPRGGEGWGEGSSASPVPRFLLTHTFRL